MASSEKEIEAAEFEGDVVAALPLALLESVRAHDRPGEVLEDEDLVLSLPRRFGLSDVIRGQIMRYETAERTGKSVRLNEVLQLVRLVLRRPDAEMILRETGGRIAEWRYARVSKTLARLYRMLPVRAAMLPVARAARRLFIEFRAGRDVTAHRHPFSVRVTDPIAPRLDASGITCALYTAALEKHAQLYTNRSWYVVHTHCRAQGGEYCEWQATELPAG